MLSQKHEVFIATFFDEKIYPTTFEYNGRHFCLNQKGSENKIYSTFQRIKFILNIIKENNIDYSVSFLKSADLINSMITPRIERISCIRSDVRRLFSQNKLSRFFWSSVYKKMHKVVFQTTQNRDNFRNLLNLSVDLHVIPNEYKISEVLSKSRQDFPCLNWSEYFVLIQVARLYDVKGQWSLFPILKELHNRGHKNVRIVILGTGPMLDEYVFICNQLGLRSIYTSDACFDFTKYDVIFKSFTDNPYMYVANSNAFIFTSISEGFPNAMAEAMIIGKFSFVSDFDGVSRYLFDLDDKELQTPIESEYGFILPVIHEKKGPVFDSKIILWVDTIEKYIHKDLSIYEDPIRQKMSMFDISYISLKWSSIFS